MSRKHAISLTSLHLAGTSLQRGVQTTSTISLLVARPLGQRDQRGGLDAEKRASENGTSLPSAVVRNGSASEQLGLPPLQAGSPTSLTTELPHPPPGTQYQKYEILTANDFSARACSDRTWAGLSGFR
jgi:hypothetical protein